MRNTTGQEIREGRTILTNVRQIFLRPNGIIILTAVYEVDAEQLFRVMVYIIDMAICMYTRVYKPIG